MKKINIIYDNYKEFGLRYTTKLINAKISGEKSIDKTIQLKYNYLYNFSKELIDSYKTAEYIDSLNPNRCLDSVVYLWQFWWQGTENLPDIVKICMKSVEDNTNDKRIIIKIITKENFDEYVDIPDYIIQKVKTGIISLTHFSDILRVSLLNKFGGIWVDSTIFLTDDLTEDILDSDLFSIKLGKSKINKKSLGQQITEGRWSGFFWKSNRNNILFDFLENSLFLYWKYHDYIIDYFIMNLFIDIAYNNIPFVKEQIDNIPISNPNLYELSNIMCLDFNQDNFEDIKNKTSIFKLTYKDKLVERNTNNCTTYYGYLCNKYLNSKKK